MRFRFSNGLFPEHAVVGLGVPDRKFFQKGQHSTPEESIYLNTEISA